MAEAFSRETEVLLERADRAIANSRKIVERRRQMIASHTASRLRQLGVIAEPK
jgi:hypothetical protein